MTISQLIKRLKFVSKNLGGKTEVAISIGNGYFGLIEHKSFGFYKNVLIVYPICSTKSDNKVLGLLEKGGTLDNTTKM